MRAYPVPGKRKPWRVQIEFLDGTTIEGMSDEDVLGRWQRLSAWTSPALAENRWAWMERVVDRCRVVYGARLPWVGPETPPEDFFDALAGERCLILRRND